MARRRLEVADVVRAHRAALVAHRSGRISPAERRVLDDLVACRTAAKGGHVERCTQCTNERIAYNSCRNRHCPKCQESARAHWLAEREKELLPVEYFHLVFTIPRELLPLARQNRRIVYDILFRASAEALTTLAADRKRLGTEIGFLSVLHTWGQRLDLHPHVHCVIPGGGIAHDGARWVSCRSRFFLPVRPLSRLFRGKFLDRLKRAFVDGRLRLLGSLAPLQDRVAFESFLRALFAAKWYVHAKAPFGGPEVVLRYLARYTHRVAISNSRLLEMRDGKVTFSWKDYRHGDRKSTMTLEAVEFLQRFLLHLLPTGFTRIRHYGFLGNRCRKAKLDACRDLLARTDRRVVPTSPPAFVDGPRCPECGRGHMVCILVLESWDDRLKIGTRRAEDTS